MGNGRAPGWKPVWQAPGERLESVRRPRRPPWPNMGQRFLHDHTTRGLAVRGAWCMRSGAPLRWRGLPALPPGHQPSFRRLIHERTHPCGRTGPERQAVDRRPVARIRKHRMARSGQPRDAAGAGPPAVCHGPGDRCRRGGGQRGFQDLAEEAHRRARIFLKYQQLIREHMAELAALLTAEQGKTLADAEGDVFRGLEVVEHAAGIGNLQLGELANNVATGVDTYTLLQPLGVCAGITPFNFPAMIPLWMFPMAIATGNTFVLKPSEQDPMVTMRLAELALAAGIPPGVLNVVHGGEMAVNALCDHQDIKAVSFVGSTKVGTHVYQRATLAGKRVQ